MCIYTHVHMYAHIYAFKCMATKYVCVFCMFASMCIFMFIWCAICHKHIRIK